MHDVDPAESRWYGNDADLFPLCDPVDNEDVDLWRSWLNLFELKD